MQLTVLVVYLSAAAKQASGATFLGVAVQPDERPAVDTYYRLDAQPELDLVAVDTRTSAGTTLLGGSADDDVPQPYMLLDDDDDDEAEPERTPHQAATTGRNHAKPHAASQTRRAHIPAFDPSATRMLLKQAPVLPNATLMARLTSLRLQQQMGKRVDPDAFDEVIGSIRSQMSTQLQDHVTSLGTDLHTRAGAIESCSANHGFEATSAGFNAAGVTYGAAVGEYTSAVQNHQTECNARDTTCGQRDANGVALYNVVRGSTQCGLPAQPAPGTTFDDDFPLANVLTWAANIESVHGQWSESKGRCGAAETSCAEAETATAEKEAAKAEACSVLEGAARDGASGYDACYHSAKGEFDVAMNFAAGLTMQKELVMQLETLVCYIKVAMKTVNDADVAARTDGAIECGDDDDSYQCTCTSNDGEEFQQMYFMGVTVPDEPSKDAGWDDKNCPETPAPGPDMSYLWHEPRPAKAFAGVLVAGDTGAGKGLNQFSEPQGLALGPDGYTFFVADFKNNRVVKWPRGAAQGIIVAGANDSSAGTTLDKLTRPKGVAVDADECVYVSDEVATRRVVKWCPGATQGVVVAGGNGHGDGLNQFRQPYGVVVDADKNVYVSDEELNRVVKWSPGSAQGEVVAGGNGAGFAFNQLLRPRDVAVLEDGTLYINDSGNKRIVKWPPGAVQGVIMAGGTPNPGRNCALNTIHGSVGFHVSADETLLITDAGCDDVLKWSPGATTGIIWAGGNQRGAGLNQFSGVYGVTVNADGVMLVLDSNNNRVVAW